MCVGGDFVDYPIIEVEGIGPVYKEKLAELGINTTRELLERARTPSGREQLAEESDISEKLILEWANLADLMRVKGVGEEWSDLLEEVGVDTVPELAQRNPDNLWRTIEDLDVSRTRLVRKKPTKDQVADWIEQAKGLERLLEY
jgi:predicted flap endonuclease-1-like 5' DNA nuclease